MVMERVITIVVIIKVIEMTRYGNNLNVGWLTQ
jgi:hypothetical protein